jgi:hypothetical protein
MLEAQDENVERLMWSAIRALCEQAEYIAQLASQLKEQKGGLEKEFTVKRQEAEHNASIIRRLVTRGTENHIAARTHQGK